MSKPVETTISQKISETFLYFSIISVHQKLNRPRLLSPEAECTSCRNSCQTTSDLDLKKWGDFRQMSKLSTGTSLVPSLPSKNKNLTIMQKKKNK